VTTNGTHVGTLKWFDLRKGYGFLQFEGKDIYIHCAESRLVAHVTPAGVKFGERFIPKNDKRFNEPGAKIAFILADGPRGLAGKPWGFVENP
jgi:hypothetical protein